jgi:hypothetical protein
MTFRKLAVECAVMAGAALFFALLGPFGTFATPFGERLFNWMVFAVGGYACFRPVIAAGSALAAQTAMPRSVGIVIACLFAAIPTSLLVAALLAGLKIDDVTLARVAGLFPLVLLIGLAVTGTQMLVQRLRSGPGGSEATTVQAPSPLPTSSPLLSVLHGEILYLGNEDHYIRVYRREGSELVLMRMRDAVEALGAIDGVRVHRGWWVARSAVAQLNKDGRSVSLELVDGRIVPVSRAMVAPLRQAGWF